MDTLGLFLFGQREIKIQRQREGGCKAGERGRSRARGKFAVVLGTLAFVLLLISVPSPPAVYATFPGANGKILFESTRDGGDFDIFTMNPDGSGVTPLTNNSGIEDRFASSSADGARIAYSSTQDGGDFDIWVMNADGSGKTQLTFNSADDQGPGWSPDGAKIAFSSTQDGDYEVYIINADGTGQTQLTFNSIFDFGSAWSPDGATIAFQSGANQAAGLEIWKMNADGSGKTQLTSNSFQDTSVNWAPDGLTLLFRRDLGFGAGWAEVFSMNADGTGQTNITNTATIFESEGRFSPDGTKIVFSSNEGDPNFEVWVMNADGTGRTRLTTAAGNDFGDDWQPLLLNQAPNAICQDVTVSAGPDCTANASIDNGSFDSDSGDTITLSQSPAGPYPLGTTSVTLTVTDNHGASSQCTANITVVDDTPPATTNVSASPSSLWPPNHKMVAVTINYTDADNCGPVTCSLTVSSNEPVNGGGDGNTSPDWEVIDAHHVRLRAERAGTGSGRVYTITITCTDGAANTTSRSVTVTVPHSAPKG